VLTQQAALWALLACAICITALLLCQNMCVRSAMAAQPFSMHTHLLADSSESAVWKHVD
jgi:hypothetical protein